MKTSFLILTLSLLACFVNPLKADVKLVSSSSESQSFSNLDQALEMAYQLRSENPKEQISLVLHSGEHRLESPLNIDHRLNGLTIVGDAKDVVVKGSKLLDLKWKKNKAGLFVAKVSRDINFDQLVINGKLQTIARYPNYDESAGYWQGYADDAISSERLASWANPTTGIFHAMHGGKWGGFHYRITGIDAEGNAILEGGGQNNRPSRPHATYRMVENIFEELDAPGEWFYDKTSEKLYLYPQENVDINKATVEVVVSNSLINLVGDESQPVENVSIKGIKFMHTKHTLFEEYEPLLRSDWTIYRGGAVFIEGAKACSVSQCELVDLGGNAIFVSAYNRNINIANNHIHDCGASAISFVGDPKAVRSPSFTYHEYVDFAEMDTVWGPKTNDYPFACVAHDNLIYRIGRIEKQTAGIQIDMAMNITASHNSIYDVPRAGINIGDGTWGGHLLEYNDVFNTVLETGDHGAFNSWGRDRFWHPKRGIMNQLTSAHPNMPYWDATYTTVIRNNRFRCDHGWDIDLDDGSTNYHIYNNLCLNGGIKLREGFGRKVENNITINNALHPHVWFENSGDIMLHNIVFAGHKDVGVSGWGSEIDYNLFPDELSMMKGQVYGIDNHSAWGDPLFTDIQSMNYQVKENSPALALGFINFPMDEFGVISPSLKEIAKVPSVPTIKKHNVGGESASVEWLRVNIKNVDSKEEQSAYGLNTTEGVIIKKIGAHSVVGASGVKSGDVFLSANGIVIKDVKHFFTLLKKLGDIENIDVVMMRNQGEVQQTVRLK